MSFLAHLFERHDAPEQQSGPPPIVSSWGVPRGFSFEAGVELAAGAIVQGQFFDSASGGKMPLLFPPPGQNPRRPVLLTRIHAPIAVRATAGTVGDPLPTQALMSISLVVRSEPRWIWQGNPIALTPDAAGDMTGGNATVSEDFVNPIYVAAEDQASLAYSVSFDKTVNIGGNQNTYIVYVAQQWIPNAAIQNAAGAMYWRTADDG